MAPGDEEGHMLERLSGNFYTPSPASKVVAAGALVLGCVGIAWFVHAGGGVKFATLHLMYLPIILAALMFGSGGGLWAGIFAGLLLGPYMPLDTVTNEAQNLDNWIVRVAFFCMVGVVVGVGAGTLRRQLRALDWLNDHDARTGLLDRTGLLRALQQRLERDGAAARPFLIVVQINNFLDIQNTLGGAFGEKLLRQICDRGRALVPADVPIALIQADRLALVFPSGSGTREQRAEIEARVREPYQIDGVPVYVDFAFGAAEFPKHARTAEELLQKASIAMHTAIVRKRPFYCYDSAADRTSRDNLLLLGMIPGALANNEFVMWHQAKFSLATGKVAGTEALLRWMHPQRGLIAPGRFIPQAEGSALINNLTQWVIAAALADMAAWTARGQELGVAINLSVRNLHDRALLDSLHETVSLHRIDPQQVELEITESAVMDDFEYCGQLIARLRNRGYRVSIDDFGTGHSSLAYLKKLPVSALKIDQTFVRRLGRDRSDQKIVRTILGLAEALGLESIAEGVEDETALRLLSDWGCDYVQGYALHRPAPYETFLAWLEERGRIRRPGSGYAWRGVDWIDCEPVEQVAEE
jgi:predicted signal transduction protein with EAL and GGDEF domain